MTELVWVSLLIFIVAVLMTMVGKGGGNFYVVILTLASLPMHEAATIGQFILFAASLAALIIFQKGKSISWKLGIFIGLTTAISALAGGYLSHYFSGFQLKLIFSVMLIVAGAIMLLPIKKEKGGNTPPSATFTIRSEEDIYSVNIWIALPVTLVTGFASGMVGVSGGSFLVPLMVLACSVPMHVAVGTASIVIAATSLMGFTGHALRGDFNPAWGLPLAFVTIAGGILGGRFSLKTKPKHLKRLFAYTNWLAALFMIYNAIQTITN
jgi:uncharacterized membrane protein YfcA